MNGLNPEQLSDEALKRIPRGWRLLESKAEQKEFGKEGQLILRCYSHTLNRWMYRFCGEENPHWTYITKRTSGWWKRTYCESSLSNIEKGLQNIISELSEIRAALRKQNS